MSYFNEKDVSQLQEELKVEWVTLGKKDVLLEELKGLSYLGEKSCIIFQLILS